MLRNDKEVHLIPRNSERSISNAVESSHVLVPDVRSTVEREFRRMEQVHDRIRSEELAMRLGEINH
jgi:hypothetical protein